MRLTIVSPFPPAISGIGQYGFHVSQLLQRSDAFEKITVLTGHNGVAPPQSISDIEIFPGWHLGDLGIRHTIRDKLARTNPDLIWFNLGASVFGRSPLANLSGFLSILQVKRSGLPIVVTLHEIPELTDLKALQAPGGILAKYGARLLTHIATRGDVICLTAQRYAECLSARYKTGQFFHIPLGAYRSPSPLPASDAPELLLFTTMAPFKGVELLIQAFEKLRATRPNLRLTVAGAEHNRFPGYINKIQRKYQRVDGIRWLGMVPENDVKDLYRRAQLVILPYLAATGSSSVLWQAAMYGRAIIASDLDEIRSAVNEAGLNVSLFRPRDVESLTAAISQLLSSPESRRSQIQTNLAVTQRFGPQNTYQAYLRAFNLALALNHSSRRIPISSTPEEVF